MENTYPNRCEEVLAHHGVLGMKWGVRRYQNKDGSLTDAGRRHLERERKYGVRNSEYTISIIEKQKKKKEKKADKTASKEVKQLKELRDSLRKFKSMKFKELSDKDIKQAMDLSDSIIRQHQQAFQTHLNNVQMQDQINQTTLLQNQLINQQVMDMVHLQNVQNSINMAMMTGPPPMMF